MGLHLWFAVTLVVPLAVCAQSVPHTETDVISSAEDAFGLTLGPQSLGLYSPSSVRGFSPITAGNARIDGLYFDQQGLIGPRLVDETRIRVGLTAVEFPWPAPTGIVDYTLRGEMDSPALSTIAYAGPYETSGVDVDGHERFWGGRMAVEAGAAYRSDVDIPGLTTRVSAFAVIPQWVPNERLTVRAFWTRLRFADGKTQPTLYLGPGQAAPHVPTRYFGQPWAETDDYSDDYGVLINAKPAPHWAVRAGIFRSTHDLPRSFADLYLETSSTATAEHMLLAEPDQFYGSTSGEIQLSHTVVATSWQQRLILGARGRDLTARYGGADSLDLGVGRAGEMKPLAQPLFAFEARTADRIREYSAGASYTFQWRQKMELTEGVQRASYSRAVADPALGGSTTSLRPWLYNSSLVLHPSRRLVLFGALTRGLEDSGVAPANAVNRGAVLGAVRSSQEEVGGKYAFSRSLTLIAAAFDVRKPYFALNEQGIFGSVGLERHRGAEVSLAGEVVSGLSVVAGALLLFPEVTTAGSQETIGSTPVGQPRWTTQLSIDDRISRFPDLSVDLALTTRGSRMVRADDRAEVGGYGTLDLGARYRLRWGQNSGTLRVQVTNVANSFNWYVATDGGVQPIEPRRASAYLVVDW